MTNTPISNAAEATREDHRSKSTGRFQEHTHADTGLTIDPAQARRAQAEQHARDMTFAADEAHRAMNQARAAVAAMALHGQGIDAGRVYIEGDSKHWHVSQAFAKDGAVLNNKATTAVQNAMKDAEVVYEARYQADGVDLAGLQDWTPQTPMAKAAARVEKALAVSVQKDEPETMATDLLTDLRLWAEKEHVDFEEILETSYQHYEEESEAFGAEPAAPRDAAAEKQQLSAYADGQPDTYEGRLAANRARTAIAAREIEEFMPEASGYVMSLDPKGGVGVARAWDQQGWTMGRHDREAIAGELTSAGVVYTTGMVDLKTMRNWLPGGTADEHGAA